MVLFMRWLELLEGIAKCQRLMKILSLTSELPDLTQPRTQQLAIVN